MNKTILTLALPAMLTNVATALFGLADVWVIGRLGDVTAQGGVEIGAKLITALLILFNFLRDGVFVGAGWTRAMLLIMAAALAAFLVLLVVLQCFGEGGLWLAFCLFLFARGAGQAVMLPGPVRQSFDLSPAGDARIGS